MPPDSLLVSAALEAADALRHAANLAELTVQGPDPHMAVLHLMQGMTVARAALRRIRRRAF